MKVREAHSIDISVTQRKPLSASIAVSAGAILIFVGAHANLSHAADFDSPMSKLENPSENNRFPKYAGGSTKSGSLGQMIHDARIKDHKERATCRKG
jgi:hypothetical protein